MNPLLASAGLGTIAAWVLLAYLVVLLGLGLLGYLRSRTTEEDFYLAGRGQGFLVTVMTIMATFFSSAAILGIPGTVYKDGVAFMLFALNLPVAGACIYVLGSRIRRIGRRRGFVTQADMIASYYGDTPALRLVVAFSGFVFVMLYVIMQIKAGGYLAQVMFPTTEPVHFMGFRMEVFELGATLLSLVTMFYVLVGGMRSVAWTDVLQGTLLIIGMLTASVATVVSMGGPAGFFDTFRELPAQALSLPGPRGIWNPTTLLTICAVASIASIIQPGQWMRLYAARNDRTLKQSALAFSVILPLCFLLGVMPVALAGRGLFPPEVGNGLQLAHPAVAEFDQIIVVMIKEQLPELLGFTGMILVAVILVAILAASMSTADSNLHALSAVLTRDVYDRFLRPGSGELERAWVGRGVIVGATLLALWFVNSLHHNPDFRPFQMIAEIMFVAVASSCQILPATVDMLFLRRGTRAGMVAGLAAGLAVVLCFTPFPVAFLEGAGLEAPARLLQAVTGLFRSYFDIGFCGMVVNIAVFAAVSRFTQPVSAERAAAFARDLEPD